MAATTKTTSALATAMSGKTPEVNEFSANNHSSEAQKRESAFAAAIGRTAGSGETQREKASKNTQNPIQGFDSPKEQQLAKKETSKELQEHRARINAEDEKQHAIFDADAAKDSARIDQILSEFEAKMSPEAKKSYVELGNLAASNHTSPTIEKRGSVGAKNHIHKAQIRLRKVQARLNTGKSSNWATALNMKTRKRQKGPRGFGAEMKQANTSVEQTRAVQKEMQQMDIGVGGE